MGLVDVKYDVQCLIILGGKSSRFVDESTDPKPNYLICGKTWLSWQLKFVSQLGLKKVILVLGYHFEELLRVHPFLKINELVPFGDLSILTILNEDPKRGSFSSLQLGLKNSTSLKVLYFPIDVPTLDLATFQKLLSVDGSYDVIKCCYENKGGHPLLIQGSFLQSLKSEALSDSQLNLLIRGLDQQLVHRLSVDSDSVLLNLNDPASLDEYAKNFQFRFERLDKVLAQS